MVRGRWLSRRRCSPTRICASVLARLMGEWGYEPDNAVIDEMLGHLETFRVASPLAVHEILQDPKRETAEPSW